MASLIESLILGIVQGLTEFLPVSSTAHLILIPWFLGLPDPGLYFDASLHFGTFLAILLFFFKDLIRILIAGVKSVKNVKKAEGDGRLFWFLLAATVPGALFGILLESKIETVFRNPALIAFTLAFFGIVIWVVDRNLKSERKLGGMNFKDAVLIGLSQALALVPGVSRSGITMVTGRYLGFSREDSVRFSFLMSAPIIFGSAVSSLLKIVKMKGSAELGLLPLLVGIGASFVFGYLSIRFLLRYVSKNSFNIFVIYRLILASLVLLSILAFA